MRTGYKKVNVMCRTETHRKLINLTFLKIVKLIKTNFAQIYIDRDHDWIRASNHITHVKINLWIPALRSSFTGGKIHFWLQIYLF